jgi:hypothetical protein
MRARSLRALTAGPSLTDLENSTCATIHKFSEYPAVVITVLTQHYAMLQRNLLYTSVTRGKRLVVLVGQKKAVAIAVRNAGGVGRSWRWLSADVSMRYVSAPSHHVGRGFIWRARKYETSQLHRFKQCTRQVR